MIIRYKTKVDRENMAKFVANCMGDRFDPYMPNEDDDTFWTVDRGNDWKVQFSDEDDCIMEIWHRYENKDAVESLAKWLTYLMGGHFGS